MLKNSVINLIVTNAPKTHSSSGTLTCSISPDHDLVYAIRKRCSPKGPAKTLTFRHLKSLNEALNKKIGELITNDPWRIMDFCPNVNEPFKVFVFFTNLILDKTAPVQSVLVKHAEWLTADFERFLHSRDCAERQFHASRTPQSWENFTVKRNQVKFAKRKLKASRYETIS